MWCRGKRWSDRGVGILPRTGATVLSWVSVGGIQVGAWLMDCGSAWVTVGDVVVITSMGGSVSVGSGVISLVVTNFCSYGELRVWSLVRITIDSGDLLGEILWNIFCLQSSFQYCLSGPSVKVSILYTGVASSSWTISWSRGGHGASVVLGKGSGSGCCCPHCAHACWLVYLPLRDWWIIGKLGLAAGLWNVIGDIEVGVALPVYIMAVGGSFMDHCFQSGGGHGLSFWL